jgi:hypothetical protein
MEFLLGHFIHSREPLSYNRFNWVTASFELSPPPTVIFMWLFFAHRFTINSSETPPMFLKRLQEHEIASKSLSFLTATIQDYGISVIYKRRCIVIKDKFSKADFVIQLKVSGQNRGSRLDVLIRPSVANIIMNLLMAFFALIIPFPIVAKIGFLGVLIVFQLIALGFQAWWTRDLLEKKLIVRDTAKDRNP